LRAISVSLVCCCGLAFAQEAVTPGHESVPTFQSKVNLVLVPVVVRDKHGEPIGNLTKDDFQLFDKGRRQAIVSFSAIKRTKETPTSDALATAPPVGTKTSASSRPEANAPKRSLIYLFDDLNIRFGAMANIRDAAVRYFKNNLAEGDRAAIYTFSGNPTLEFTSDREKLQEAVSKLRWHPPAGRSEFQCPDVSYYIADLVIVKADSQALDGLTHHTAQCAHVPLEIARNIALAAANRELIIGVHDTQVALRTLARAIRRLAAMPGERSLILASPGFFAQTPEAATALAEILDFAAKSNVVVSALSVHGVIMAEGEDITARDEPYQPWMRYRFENARVDGDVMKDLAEGTGGAFFHNNNNFEKGLERVTAAPELSYLLGFSPAELKADGKYHSLKIVLPGAKGVHIEARHGYYARPADPKDNYAAADIDDAVFSRGQATDIPIVVQTGYSKPNTGKVAKVLVTAKVDLAALHLRKAAGRSLDSLRAVLALFDPDGGYVTGAQKTVNLRLKEETLKQKDPAITLHWEFDVDPGTYVVRLVVREQASKAMTTLNRTVEIL
jgi:VWFA-related protein